MTIKGISQFIMVVAVLAASLVPAAGALAWTGCASYVTVQWGDTLGSIASACGTSVDALRAANPGLGPWLYAGQVLYIPTGAAPAYASYPSQIGSNTYVVRRGDTLGGIANLNGFSLAEVLAVNPQIWNPSLIYPGQVINLPAGSHHVFYDYPSTHTPSYFCPPCNNPTPTPSYSSDYSYLKVTYEHGLLVRTGPGLNYPEIKSPYVSAVKNSQWQYRNSSETSDSIHFVWVEVTLSRYVVGYTTGWILTRDSLGKYFTDPEIGPFLDPNDP